MTGLDAQSGASAFLSGKAIALSVSESPDMKVFGLSDLHLQDATVEIARYMLVAGGELIYGGDLRANGFTLKLFDLVSRHRPSAVPSTASTGSVGIAQATPPPAITNFLPWPAHIKFSSDEIEQNAAAAARVVLLDRKGGAIDIGARPSANAILDKSDWDEGLTAMRSLATSQMFARLALGGRTEKYMGRMPGVAEEVLLALKARRCVYLLGGFGGCARDIAETLGIASPSPARPLVGQRTWAGLDEFRGFGPDSLNNGLSLDENRRLAETPHIDEATTLVLRGLRRAVASGTHP